jgi:CubicO group peptidase (beta-lactamase class C family)
MPRHYLLLFLTLLSLASGASAQENRDTSGLSKRPVDSAERRKRVDRLFARWDKRTTPGGVVAVLQDGKIRYSRGYGMANLEHNIPNTPATLFHIASVSKQFTAFAIQLLVQDGKLSLDDDVRKYITELPDFGKTITVRHLVYHTSGLRDQPHLMWLGGWRFEDAVTEQDVLYLVSQQRELNFPPGQEDLYSNTGYTLLAILVQRVSGKSLSEFAQERIFKPLGMKHTLFPTDYSVVVKNRAFSYQPGPGDAYRALSLADSTLGATGVVTSVEDMARWDQNFDEGRVGGESVLAAMLKKGTLDNGREINRGSGLVIEEYRGLPVIKHTGSIAGYRSRYIRFPEQRFSVVVLANTADVDTEDLAWQVADIYLEEKLKPVSAQVSSALTDLPAEVRVEPKVLDSYVGDYELQPGNIVTITRDNDHLMAQGTGQGRVPLFASSPTTFFLKNAKVELTFVKPEDADTAREMVLRRQNENRTARRIASAPLKDYIGTFYSQELNVLYTVTLRDGKLFLRHPRGEAEMVRTLPDTFVLPFPIDNLRYTRGASGGCDGFTIDDGRVRNLRFVKVEIKAVER